MDSVQDASSRQDAQPEHIFFVENFRHSGQHDRRSPVVPMTPVIHETKVQSFFDRAQIVTYILLRPLVRRCFGTPTQC